MLHARKQQGSRDSLLRGLKHELRTPLNAILGFADLLLGELDGPLQADERENVQMVREAGELLLSLINDVLDLGTALMLPAPPYESVVDVVQLLEQLRSELERLRGMRPIHVRVVSTLSSLEVSLDQQQLVRALRCLAEVTLACTSAGEIVLGVERDATGLELELRADGFLSAPAADGGSSTLAALLSGAEPTPSHTRDRAARGPRLKLQIAHALFARLGAEVRAEPSRLCVRVPLTAAATKHDSPERDVPLALTYIAAMSHELRTPLNAIMGFSELLTRHGQHTWTDSQQRSVAIVHERAFDLATLVDDMIDWAKLEAGELMVNVAPVQVSALLERVHSAATERSGARGLKLTLQLPPQADTQIQVDEARCVQALLGLLDHAIRSQPGPTIQIRVQRTAAELRFVVEDQGLQIRPEDQARVFDAFRPSYALTGQRIAGLQLGPAVARSLFRAHGGDVWFESLLSRGTTFTAVLPLPNSTDSA